MLSEQISGPLVERMGQFYFPRILISILDSENGTSFLKNLHNLRILKITRSIRVAQTVVSWLAANEDQKNL